VECSRCEASWSLAAARLATRPEAVLIGDDIPAFPSIADGSEAAADATDHRRALTSVLLRLTGAETVADDIPEHLVKHAGMLRRTYPDDILRWQPAAVARPSISAMTACGTR
jgi:hypothetical protein